MLTFLRFSILAMLAMPARAQAPRVVADIAPVHALVAQVMEGVGEPDLILRPGASPHGYALRPSQARVLQNAELVVWIGPELTPWLEKPIASLAGGATKLGLLSADATQVLTFRDGGEEHDHDHDGKDPHAWLDPANAQIWLMMIAMQLSSLDPENAETYQKNAVSAQVELTQVSASITAMLTPVQSHPFVTFHDAYQYFEAGFGLHNVGFVSLSDGADASPARVAALRDRVAELGVRCAFSEPGFDTGVLQGIDTDNRLTVAILDPMGRDLAVGVGLYSALLLDMGRSIAECLSRPD